VSDFLLDDVVRLFANAAPVFLGRLTPIILALHVALFTLQFAWDLIRWNLSDSSTIAGVARKLLVFLFTYGLIVILPFWLPPVLRGWEELGQLVSGMPGLGPSAIFEQGIALAFELYDSWKEFAILILPGVNALRLIVFLATLIAWTVIAFHLAKLLVESAIAIGGLPIMLAFAGHSVTFGMAEGFFRYLIHLGVRIYVTYLLVGVGRHLAVEWAQDIQLTFPLNIMTESVTLAAGAALFALLVVALPRTIAHHIAGGISFAGLNPLGHRDA
jgi:type IV secretory pathway TrbL component